MEEGERRKQEGRTARKRIADRRKSRKDSRVRESGYEGEYEE